MVGWITTDPKMAKKLRAIDDAHAKAREAATGLPLAEKLAAYRAADEARRDAYEALALSFEEG